VITALYTVLVEGDDLSDPVADAVRSILDGHVVLARSLAEKGHFPAIDPLASVSRVATEVTPTPVQRAGNVIRDLMGAYREAQDLIHIGAYVRGSDARVDTACAAMPQINAFLRQASNERFQLEETQARLVALAFQFERNLKA
jgi:flagellum-specific ATP synthase